ncbi:hypothetical protein JD969_08330 [Planctomycetota bacterium]|nr:hypothetical protein JD969_08330 [Planctomycetota bacterium]
MQTAQAFQPKSINDVIECIINAAKHEVYETEPNQRKHERVMLQVPVEIGTCAIREGKPRDFAAISKAWALDISESGLGLIIERFWDVDETGLLWVNLKSMVFNSTCPCAGLIPIVPRYCVKMLEQTYRLGCLFETDMDKVMRLARRSLS